jgi:hypothetical protein
MKAEFVGYIFCESVATEYDYRNVKRKKNGIAVIETVLQEAGIPNRNGRVYPKDVLSHALDGAYVQEKINTNSWLGESNHPNDKSLERQLSVDMNNTSHLITKYWWDKTDPNLLVGIVETAYNDIGRNLAGLILENNMRASFSMRGVGDVLKAGGRITVKKPMRLVTYDLVNYPSHVKAYQRSTNTIISEATPIPISELAVYAAERSEEFRQLNEEILHINESDLLLSFNENKNLVIGNRNTEKPEAIIKLNSTVSKEIDSFFKNFF